MIKIVYTFVSIPKWKPKKIKMIKWYWNFDFLIFYYSKILIESDSLIVWGNSRLRVSGKNKGVTAPITPQIPNTKNGKLTQIKLPFF